MWWRRMVRIFAHWAALANWSTIESPYINYYPLNCSHCFEITLSMPAISPSVNTAKPPIMWLPAIVLTATFLVAITIVPWYGFMHGYSWGNWLAFVLFLGCN